MLIAFITHPDARNREGENDPYFRGLSDRGRKEAILAAQRIRTLLQEENVEFVDTILTSPKSRCIETLITVGNALYEIVKTDTPVINKNLQAGNLTQDSFNEVLKNLNNSAALLVFVHADLAGLFKDEIQESALNGNWFHEIRPVIALAMYDHSNLKLLRCEKLENSSWVSIMKKTKPR